MKSSALATALLVLATAGANAQSSVTVYGTVDLGLVLDSGSPQGKSVRVSSGAAKASRLGFRGLEDLGGGYKAGFTLETGFCADSAAGAPNFCTANNQFMGRQAHGDLSGGFGNLSAGRQYTMDYLHFAALDPFAAGYSGKANNVMDATTVRLNNSVRYVTPTLEGFTAGAEMALGETTGDWRAGREFGGELTYASGPLYAGVTYYDLDNANGIEAARKNTLLGATYDLSVVKLHFMAQRSTGAPTGAAQLDSVDLLGGVTVPLGAGSVMASYLRHDDRSSQDRDASQWALGYNYPLSKRTTAYASFAHIDNRAGATYTVGNQTETGTGNKAFDLGVFHNF